MDNTEIFLDKYKELENAAISEPVLTCIADTSFH